MSAIMAHAGLMMSQYDGDALTLFTRFASPPSAVVKAKINTLIITLKLQGIWQLLDSLYVPAKVGEQTGGLCDWIRATESATLASFSSWSNDYGFEAASGGIISTNYHPANDATNLQRDNNCMFVWPTQLPNYTGGVGNHNIFVMSGVGQFRLGYQDTGLSRLSPVICNNASIADTTTSLSVDELFAIGRNSSTNAHLFKGSTILKTSATASTVIDTGASYDIKLLEVDPLTDNQGGVGVWGAGAYLDTTKLAALKAAIQAYMA